MPRDRILIVDDEESVRFGVRAFLESHDFEVREAGTCADAELAIRTTPPPDAAVLDYRLPDGTALDLLARFETSGVDLPVVILTAHGSIELAVQAIKQGAEQFLTKPVELPALLVVLRRMIEIGRLRRRELAERPRRDAAPRDPFLGTSAQIRELAESARRIADSDRAALIVGETGCGKGVLARWLHAQGPRKLEPFVDVNCAGLEREFLESELFGHEKGAYTGAVAAKAGLLELAHRGTLFLDEVGDLDLAVQGKLLKVLEEQAFRRLGSVRDRVVDMRLIAATHQDLPGRIRDRKFREDLYFRINIIPIVIPPLRDRAEDVVVLAQRILSEVAADLGRPPVTLSADATRALVGHPWPGNIRELRNVLERAALLADTAELRAGDMRFESAPGVAAVATPADLTLDELQRRHILRVLEEESGHVERAARRLGIPRSSLYQKLKSLGLPRP